MRTFCGGIPVCKFIILTILLSNLASSQNNQQPYPVLVGTPTFNLFNGLLRYLGEPNSNGGVRIQRMTSTAAPATTDVETTYNSKNPIYQYPVIKITDANYTQIAGQHEWMYIKFFTEWCPHSRAIIPVWHEVAYRLSSTKITVAEVQCEANDDTLCSKFKVVAYPSFKLIRKGVIRQAIVGEETADKLVNDAWKVYLKESRIG